LYPCASAKVLERANAEASANAENRMVGSSSCDRQPVTFAQVPFTRTPSPLLLPTTCLRQLILAWTRASEQDQAAFLDWVSGTTTRTPCRGHAANFKKFAAIYPADLTSPARPCPMPARSRCSDSRAPAYASAGPGLAPQRPPGLRGRLLLCGEPGRQRSWCGTCEALAYFLSWNRSLASSKCAPWVGAAGRELLMRCGIDHDGPADLGTSSARETRSSVTVKRVLLRLG
jgi:hypothetical protein